MRYKLGSNRIAIRKIKYCTNGAALFWHNRKQKGEIQKASHLFNFPFIKVFAELFSKSDCFLRLALPLLVIFFPCDD